MKNINKAFVVKKPLDLTKLFEEYKEFADLFSRELSDKLPSRRFYDYKISLISGVVFPFSFFYNILIFNEIFKKNINNTSD